MPFWRRKPRLREIGEAEAYDRSYGQPRLDVKRIVLPPRRPRHREVLATGEVLRRAFLDRLAGREEVEPPAEPSAPSEPNAPSEEA